MTTPSKPKTPIEEILGKSERMVAFEARQIDQESRTVELAWASEAPVQRWFGQEILDITAKSVRLGRLKDGAPLLLQHDPDRQIGVVESVRLDADRRARATVRFSRGALGQEVFQDVQDGIRRNVSVGYIVHKAEVQEYGEEDEPVYRVTDWEPLEISMVSIPADATAQVGRSAPSTPTEDKAMPDKIKAPASELETPEERQAEDQLEINTPETPKPDASRAQANARIREIGARFGMEREAEDHIALDSSVSEFQAIVREAQGKRIRPVPAVPRIEMVIPRRSKRLRAFENTRDGEEAAYRAGRWAQAVLYGDQDALRWCKDYNVRVMTGVSSSTSAVVPDEMVLPIIDLREQYGVARRYCFIHPMASDTAIVPRRKSGTTAYFVGRTDATTESDAAFDDIQLVAREVAALTRISRAYAADAAIDLADHLAGEMAYSFAVKEDDCLFNGDGTSTYGGIYGIRPKIIDGNHTQGAIDGASGIDTLAEVTNDELISVIGALPEYPGINPKWFCSKLANSLVFDALKIAGGGNTISDIGRRPSMEYLGDEIVISQSMPKVTTDLSNVVMLVYGDLGMGVTFGDRQGIEVEVLRERYAEYRQIGIQAVERFDIVVHGLGDTSAAGPIVALVGE